MEKEKLLQLTQELESNPQTGLSTNEAKERLEKYGPNTLKEEKKKSVIVKFLEQFKDILVIILLIAAVISIIVEPSEWIDSLIIFIVVIVNAVIGVFQESKAEKSLDALKKMSNPISKVLRDGIVINIDSNNLVKGDIIQIEAGDFIPADSILIEAHSLKVNESSLTGESVPIEKEASFICGSAAIGDQKDKVFASTFVTYGRAKAIIYHTGMETEIGKIATQLNNEKSKQTPLQNKLAQIGKAMGILSIIICIFVFAFQILNKESILDAFKTAVALAVAAIPEGLATVVTIILSVGVNKMSSKNAIVKKLPAVETLGCTSIVCSDKTGTLTQNKMTVVELFDSQKQELPFNKNKLVSLFSLCCDGKINYVDGKEIRIGDPTETALIEANNKYGELDTSSIERIKEIPFDSERKLMTVVVKLNNEYISITKGAPDQIFAICNNINQSIINANEDMASRALRVLGLAIKKVAKDTPSNELEKDLTYMGLIGMIDPARDEVKISIQEATKAGIKTIMITGDHIITAKAIATELGIFHTGDIAVTSQELSNMSDDELSAKLEKISVYARVSPSDKVRIVKAWQGKGQVVAMTGDGVNDSPALKASDIGCAMGITGTDVAKEASAMILTDDNFSTIITAVKEGRNIYDNIKKCVKYLLSSNIGEVLTIFLVSCISLFSSTTYPVPLLPIHLLWINLITDSLPAFALGMEKSTDELMSRPPRDKNESFFANHLGLHIAIEGAFIGLLTLISFFIGFNYSPKTGQTMTFITLSTLQLFHSFNMKSEHSIFNKELFKNKWLVGSFILGILLQCVVLFVSPIREIFKLAELNSTQLLISLSLAFSIIIVMEIYKLIKKIISNIKNK